MKKIQKITAIASITTVAFLSFTSAIAKKNAGTDYEGMKDSEMLVRVLDRIDELEVKIDAIQSEFKTAGLTVTTCIQGGVAGEIGMNLEAAAAVGADGSVGVKVYGNGVDLGVEGNVTGSTNSSQSIGMGTETSVCFDLPILAFSDVTRLDVAELIDPSITQDHRDQLQAQINSGQEVIYKNLSQFMMNASLKAAETTTAAIPIIEDGIDVMVKMPDVVDQLNNTVSDLVQTKDPLVVKTMINQAPIAELPYMTNISAFVNEVSNFNINENDICELAVVDDVPSLKTICDDVNTTIKPIVSVVLSLDTLQQTVNHIDGVVNTTSNVLNSTKSTVNSISGSVNTIKNKVNDILDGIGFSIF